MDYTVLAATGVLLSVGVLYRLLRPSKPLPPGPAAYPVLGNLLEFPPPDQHPWMQLTKFKETFGDIVYFHGLGNSLVVLNSLDDITNILSKRGNLSSHRPVYTVAGELMGLDRSMPLMSMTKMWQNHRKLAHFAFSPESVKKYTNTQEDISALTCLAILDDPVHFIDHVRLATGRIVMSVTYGISPQVAEHEYISHAEDTMMMISDVLAPGVFLADTLPFLKYIPKRLPFRTFHDAAREGRAMMEKMVFTPFIQVQQEIAENTATPSFVKDVLSTPDVIPGLEPEEFEEAVKWTAGSMYGAGGETTYSTIVNCILVMALYPDKQAAVQAELDHVVGDKLASIEDRESTPYLNAVIKEIMRWHPSLPLAIPHRSGEDFVYNGYLIPKNSILVPNLWAVSRDPDPDFPPEDFIPERFLPRKSGFKPADPQNYVFGFGRRICPGKYLAENSLYIMLAYLIQSFSFYPPRDENGVEQPINPTWKTGLTTFPNHFKCRIEPRSAARATMIRQRASVCS